MKSKKISAEFLVHPDRGETSKGRAEVFPQTRCGDIHVKPEPSQPGRLYNRVKLSMQWQTADEKNERDGSVWLSRTQAIELAMSILDAAHSFPVVEKS